MSDTRMEAAVISESHLPDALRRALVYAGSDGYVASLPELLHARVGASFDNVIWNEIEDDQPQSCICLMYGSPDGKRAHVYAPEGIDHLRSAHTDFGFAATPA